MYSSAVHRAIVDATRQHGIDHIAAQKAGISADTFATWRTKARAGEAPFRDLMADVDRAKGECLDSMLAELATSRKMKPIRYRTLTWLLGRADRLLGDTSKVELTGTVETRTTVTLTPETAELLRQKILGVSGDGDD